ncbi:MAG: hypothetical protein ACOC6A_02515 [Chloroflexota bacterium]
MGLVPHGAVVPAVEKVWAEVVVVAGAWVVAARGQARAVNALVLPVARGCHIGPEYPAMSFPVLGVGRKW